jgi:hypothetical protein
MADAARVARLLQPLEAVPDAAPGQVPPLRGPFQQDGARRLRLRAEPSPLRLPGLLAFPLHGGPLVLRGLALAGPFRLQGLPPGPRFFLPRGVADDGLRLADHGFGVSSGHERARLAVQRGLWGGKVASDTPCPIRDLVALPVK